jgi:CheY-like chemotaxis protein
LLELVFVLLIFFAGVAFWSCLKATRHLHKILRDPVELKRLIDHVGYDKLLAGAQQVQPPPFGTFGDTIDSWEAAHYKSLSQTRNGLLFVVLAVLAASWWLGMWYLAVSLLVFFSLSFAGLPASAKNNNADHLSSVMLNLLKWHHEHASACEGFCQRQRPQYRNLYDCLASQQEMATTPRGPEAEGEKQGAARILIVDDDKEVREVISSMLTSAGYECRAVAGGYEALALLDYKYFDTLFGDLVPGGFEALASRGSSEKFDVLLTDMLNYPLDGFSLLQSVKWRLPDLPVIVASAVTDEAVIQACISTGACEYLVEPFEREQLLATVGRALEPGGHPA